jgi:hypothetical protein
MIFVEGNKLSWILEALNYFLSELIIDLNVTFHLEVSKNKIVIIFPSELRNSLKSMHRPREPG